MRSAANPSARRVSASASKKNVLQLPASSGSSACEKDASPGPPAAEAAASYLDAKEGSEELIKRLESQRIGDRNKKHDFGFNFDPVATNDESESRAGRLLPRRASGESLHLDAGASARGERMLASR